MSSCDGVLKETSSTSAVDASPLAQIPVPPCDPQVAPTTDGYHHPGEDCLMCHHQGGMGPPFTFAGTLFDSPGGAMAVPGVTFHLIDAMGTDVVVNTHGNGNFYSTDLVTFPVVAFVSMCPDVKPMITPIGEADGSCNTSGCHTSGFRLHP